MNIYTQQIKWFAHISNIQVTFLPLKFVFNGNPLFCDMQSGYVETPMKNNFLFYFSVIMICVLLGWRTKKPNIMTTKEYLTQ